MGGRGRARDYSASEEGKSDNGLGRDKRDWRTGAAGTGVVWNRWEVVDFAEINT